MSRVPLDSPYVRSAKLARDHVSWLSNTFAFRRQVGYDYKELCAICFFLLGLALSLIRLASQLGIDRACSNLWLQAYFALAARVRTCRALVSHVLYAVICQLSEIISRWPVAIWAESMRAQVSGSSRTTSQMFSTTDGAREDRLFIEA